MKLYKFNPKINGNVAEKPEIKLLNKITTFLLVFCLLFCFLALITTSTYFYANVDGKSMFPTINSVNENDIAYYTKTKLAKKGDVIIVDYGFSNKNFRAIKRLIATGGDTVCYYNNHIYVNGEAINEQYLIDDYEYLKNNTDILKNSGYLTAEDWLEGGYQSSKAKFENFCAKLVNNSLSEYEKKSTFQKNYQTDYLGSIVYNSVIDSYVLTIPDGYIFFLGDNRGGSNDSSSLGIAEEKYLVAKVDFVADENATIFSKFTSQVVHLFS